jgi:hypothetical protein
MQMNRLQRIKGVPMGEELEHCSLLLLLGHPFNAGHHTTDYVQTTLVLCFCVSLNSTRTGAGPVSLQCDPPAC